MSVCPGGGQDAKQSQEAGLGDCKGQCGVLGESDTTEKGGINMGSVGWIPGNT